MAAVGIDAVKAYLRLETDAEDALIATLVAAAEGVAERFLGAPLDGEVPAAVAQGIVRLAAHFHAHRDDDAGPPAVVAALWRPYRQMRL
ncbi:head-tail connector protein [Sphingomonas arantia]|uniref:Head-tail connector protein n=1 Tax=Sphingomonas arantia TaxID=1460676 RepID=A0ABW4U3C7_9SPHN